MKKTIIDVKRLKKEVRDLEGLVIKYDNQVKKMQLIKDKLYDELLERYRHLRAYMATVDDYKRKIKKLENE